MQKTKFKVQGIKCANCVLLIEIRLKDKEGVVRAKVDYDSNKGVVIYDEQKINEDDIYKTIEEIGGFKVEKNNDSIKNAEEKSDYNNPDRSKEVKPPIEDSNNSGFYGLIATVVLIIFLLSTFVSHNHGSQVSGLAQNTAVQQQQPINSQQVQASTTVQKSDSPILEAYVVARCPYGLQMQRAMVDAVKNIPALAQYLKVRYIGSVSGNTITSMHGSAEATENLRQICIREEQPAKYWNYTACQMKKGDTAGCESSTGVDSAKLSACISDPSRGVAYAQKDFTLNGQYNIQGSPTLILNGAQVSESNYESRSSDGVKKIVCSGFNSQPSFCSTKLNTVQATASFSETY